MGEDGFPDGAPEVGGGRGPSADAVEDVVEGAVDLMVYGEDPKGVMLTFGNLQANTEACSVRTRVFIPEDRVLVALPLHHVYPLMARLVMPMSVGASVVFAAGLTGSAIMYAIRENQCTFIIGVPRLLEILRNSVLKKVNESFAGRIMFRTSAAVGSLRLSRLLFRKVQNAFGGHVRYVSSGGAAADPQVVRDFYALGFHLLEGYGMTETAPMITFTPPDRHKPCSPGKAIPCNEIRIRDGEVLVCGKNVMKGYYNRPEETAQAVDGDGWLHTGDLGYVDGDGFLFITGRSKELIILGNGKNINPTELEQKLMEFANGMFGECAVADDGRHLACILVPDMEVLAARGILNIRQTLMDEVIEPYNESVPSYKRINRLELSDRPLPRTRLGKIRRHVLRGLLEKGDDCRPEKRAPVRFRSSLEERICRCLGEIAGRSVHPDEHFELDLNLDSLGKMSLFSALCRELGMNLDMEMLAKHPTGRLLGEALEHETAGTRAMPRCPSPSEAVRPPSWTHGFLRMLISASMRCLSRLTVEGRSNIPGGPCIFAPNHQSILDGFYLAAALDGRRFRDTYFYATAKFFGGRFRRRMAERHNLVILEINGDIALSLARLEAVLKQGKSVVIFPEGTRSMDGSVGEFRPTFALLAAGTGVPVVPVAISGAYDVLPRWAKWPRFGRSVRIAFLPECVRREGMSAEEMCSVTRTAVGEAIGLAGGR